MRTLTQKIARPCKVDRRTIASEWARVSPNLRHISRPPWLSPALPARALGAHYGRPNKGCQRPTDDAKTLILTGGGDRLRQNEKSALTGQNNQNKKLVFGHAEDYRILFYRSYNYTYFLKVSLYNYNYHNAMPVHDRSRVRPPNQDISLPLGPLTETLSRPFPRASEASQMKSDTNDEKTPLRIPGPNTLTTENDI